MATQDQLKVLIVSPVRTLFDCAAMSVTVPGELGPFEILVHHAPIISSLSAGKIVCGGDTPCTIEIASGFVQVADNVVKICVQLHATNE